MIRRPPRSTRTHTLSLHDALPISKWDFEQSNGGIRRALQLHGGNPMPVVDYDCGRSEEHTSELKSLMRISYAVFCLKKKKKKTQVYQSVLRVKQSQKIQHYINTLLQYSRINHKLKTNTLTQ